LQQLLSISVNFAVLRANLRPQQVRNVLNYLMQTSLESKKLKTVCAGAGALGALAIGALAVGALALGAVAIGSLVIGRAKIKHLTIDSLRVRRLCVEKLEIEDPK
jgi:hypothetical protein